MPQFYKDAFAKEHARIIAEWLGEFDENLSISTETLDFDVLFVPNAGLLATDDRELDLYTRLLKTDTIVNLEFFSGTLRPENLRECRVRTNLDETKQRNKYKAAIKKINTITQDRDDAEILKAEISKPKLKFCWMIVAASTEKTLQAYGATPHPTWGQGVYLLPEIERMGAIVIPELAIDRDTLWLRTLGKDRVLKQAFRETIDLPLNHPKRNAIIDLGRSYFNFLAEQTEVDLDSEQQVDMRTLREIYLETRAESIALEERMAQTELRLQEAQQQQLAIQEQKLVMEEQNLAMQEQNLAIQEQLSQAQQRELAAQRQMTTKLLAGKFGDRVLTPEVVARLERMSGAELDDLFTQAIAWDRPDSVAAYFDRA
jgi:hypothetical protein